MAPLDRITQTFARQSHTVTEAAALLSSCLPCEERAADDAASTRASRRRYAEQDEPTQPPAPSDDDDDDTDEDETDDDTPDEQSVSWSGPIVFENQMTGDGRMIEQNALRWENLPIPLRHAPVDNGGHDGAVVVGRILTIERQQGGAIQATGDIDIGSAEGRRAARQVSKQLTRGVSVDLDDVSFEIRVASDLLREIEEDPDTEVEIEATERETDEEGRVTVADINSDDEVMISTDARIRAATIVAIPAFAGAMIELDADQTVPDDDSDDDSGDSEEEPELVASPRDLVIASSAPLAPPAAWFSDPGLTEPTHVTITDDGRIYGHLATWGTCHTAYQGQCVTPPSSDSGYAYFRVGAVLTDDGAEIPVGRITLDTLHANKNLSAADTAAHYEHTGRAVADVAAGDDGFGIWIAGAVRPSATPDQVRALRSSPLSGDWRRIGANLELVAALAVNVPGFPVPRPQGMVAGGTMTSLVASGIVPPQRVLAPGQPGALSTDDLRYLKRLADRERREDEVTAAGLRDDVTAMARRVRALKLHRQINNSG